MKLTELKPRWIGFNGWAENEGALYDGITFDCPHCRKQRLGIRFSPPIDPANLASKVLMPTYDGINVWKRVGGETFDDLTIEPSINAAITVEGHWHGYITNGEAK